MRYRTCGLLAISVLVALAADAQTLMLGLDGTYLRSSLFSFERIEISGADFTYDRGTDIGDQWSRGFPIKGRVRIDGSIVTLLHGRLSARDRVFRIVVRNDETYLIQESAISGNQGIDLSLGLRRVSP